MLPDRAVQSGLALRTAGDSGRAPLRTGVESRSFQIDSWVPRPKMRGVHQQESGEPDLQGARCQLHAFRTRPLSGDYPYLMLDATFEKVRENGRVVSMAVVIAVGVRATGESEVLGTDVGPAEDHQFWLEFLRQLVGRGLRGVRLVTSDSHLGLKQAVAQVLTGATWQRCRGPVHAQRPVDGAQGGPAMVVATQRTISAQPDRDSARETVARISRLFERRFPKLIAVLQAAAVDILAFHGFPLEHRRQVWSTNSLERLNREVGRRCEVVGIFPNRPDAAAARGCCP